MSNLDLHTRGLISPEGMGTPKFKEENESLGQRVLDRIGEDPGRYDAILIDEARTPLIISGPDNLYSFESIRDVVC